MRFITTILIISIIATVIICCPEGWKKSGFGDKYDCYKKFTYTRKEYGWKVGDDTTLKGARRRCQNDHPELGCEQWGAFIYPKCKAEYFNQACCICQMKDKNSIHCPSGYKNNNDLIDVQCIKN